MITLLIVLVLILLVCGGVPSYRSGWTPGNPYNLVVLIVVVVLLLWLFGALPVRSL
jgi:asparagine N-glycosylation enzyme membrane subunit Stt3